MNITHSNLPLKVTTGSAVPPAVLPRGRLIALLLPNHTISDVILAKHVTPLSIQFLTFLSVRVFKDRGLCGLSTFTYLMHLLVSFENYIVLLTWIFFCAVTVEKFKYFRNLLLSLRKVTQHTVDINLFNSLIFRKKKGNKKFDCIKISKEYSRKNLRDWNFWMLTLINE